jgi:ubiquinone/menaquinone biosynthesis C-methylase UbiE
LVAGCGTGQHSIEAAVRYANSDITAIDLSMSSLSFALRRTRELNIENIKYWHGDILDLSSMETEFDVIETTGVLHHMNDPMLGWRILKGCLKSKGLMRVGLYSSLARADLSEVKESMGDLEQPITNQKIYDYRNRVLDNAGPEFEKLVRYPDFFSTSELRDLLFHVQEHTFTLIEIKNMLKELGLIFCGFETVDEKTKATLSADGRGSDNLFSLDAWHNFEQLNPHYFSGMYSFWVQKPD